MTAPEIQQEIDRTRERLGETVDELAAKADVKARTQAKAAEMKARAQGKATEMKAKAQGKATEMKAKATEVSGQVRRSPVVQRRWPVAAAAASIVLVGSLLAWRRRKTRPR
jgi:regulator of protease activity HflC (stomatin/prohibitin superfamily)